MIPAVIWSLFMGESQTSTVQPRFDGSTTSQCQKAKGLKKSQEAKLAPKTSEHMGHGLQDSNVDSESGRFIKMILEKNLERLALKDVKEGPLGAERRVYAILKKGGLLSTSEKIPSLCPPASPSSRAPFVVISAVKRCTSCPPQREVGASLFTCWLCLTS